MLLILTSLYRSYIHVNGKKKLSTLITTCARTPARLGLRPPGAALVVLSLLSNYSLLPLMGYAAAAAAQLAGQHALLKPLDDPVDLSPGQVQKKRRRVGGSGPRCGRERRATSAGPRDEGGLLRGTTRAQACRQGPPRATRRLLFSALLALLCSTRTQRLATLPRQVQRRRAWRFKGRRLVRVPRALPPPLPSGTAALLRSAGPPRESQPWAAGTGAPASWACCAEPSLASLALRSASSLPFPDLCAAVSSASTMSRSFCGFVVPQAAVCSGVHSLRVFPGWVKSTPACSIFLTATRSPARTLLRKTTACCASAMGGRRPAKPLRCIKCELASSTRGVGTTGREPRDGGSPEGYHPATDRPPLYISCMILRCVASCVLAAPSASHVCAQAPRRSVVLLSGAPPIRSRTSGRCSRRGASPRAGRAGGRPPCRGSAAARAAARPACPRRSRPALRNAKERLSRASGPAKN